MAVTAVFACGCAELNDPYYSGSRYPSQYGDPYGYDRYPDSRYDRDRDDYERERRRAERERERLHDERERLERERDRDRERDRAEEQRRRYEELRAQQ